MKVRLRQPIDDETRRTLDAAKEAAERVRLWPEWKGGGGEGVTCPCCDGVGYVPPETAVALREYHDVARKMTRKMGR